MGTYEAFGRHERLDEGGIGLAFNIEHHIVHSKYVLVVIPKFSVQQHRRWGHSRYDSGFVFLP